MNDELGVVLPMEKDDLVERLRKILETVVDPEEAHMDADEALLAFIGDEDVRAAFRAIDKWYV